MVGGVFYRHSLFSSIPERHRYPLHQQDKAALIRKVAHAHAHAHAHAPLFFAFTPSLSGTRHVTRAGWRWSESSDDDEEGDVNRDAGEAISFQLGVALFNRGEYYQCHDVLESIWMKSPEPRRTVLHAILQCSVGLYHLFNQNHRGAMTEIGEGLAKLRRQRFTSGPFFNFEQEVSALLEYIYNTQLEYAACTEDLCITMDGSKESYQLLGNFAAGHSLYHLQKAEIGESYICFNTPYAAEMPPKDSTTAHSKVKVPFLNTTVDDFCKL